jgi:phage terminase large subunit-like protein
VAALYEQRRIHHVGAFPTLEDQMCAFAPDFDRARAGFSPDRVDALVWAFADLLVEQIIIVAGKDAAGHGHVLADQSARYAPTEWARTAIALYRQHKADRIVAEVNNGGDMVESTIRMIDPNVSYSAVRATRGKVIRAEPVAALYEQRRIHHVGAFPTLCWRSGHRSSGRDTSQASAG